MLWVVVSPLLGGYDPVQRTFVGAAYNLFILFVWCLLAHVASRTDLAPVAVFGWGRGASAVGTTIGWLGSAIVTPRLAEKTRHAYGVCCGHGVRAGGHLHGGAERRRYRSGAFTDRCRSGGGVSSVPGARRRRDGLTVPMRCEACAAGAAAGSDELAGRGCAAAVAGAGVQAVGASTAQQRRLPQSMLPTLPRCLTNRLVMDLRTAARRLPSALGCLIARARCWRCWWQGAPSSKFPKAVRVVQHGEISCASRIYENRRASFAKRAFRAGAR